jgi:hypothetical protein
LNNIGVIILNYRSFNDTLKCVQSVKFSLKEKIYVIDNSEDELEKTLIKNMFVNDPDVEIIFNKKNIGFAGGVNVGLKTAIKDGYSKFIILNNDSVVFADFGKKIKEALEKYPGCIISPIIQWDNTISKGRYYNRYFGLVMEIKKFVKSGWFFYITGCCMAFDKSVIDKIGFLSEKYFMYGEDIEFCHNAYQYMIPLILLDEVLMDHQGSHSSKKASLFYEYHINRGHFLLCFTLFNRNIDRFASLFGKTLVLFGRAYIRSIKNRTVAPFLGYLISVLPLKIRPK